MKSAFEGEKLALLNLSGDWQYVVEVVCSRPSHIEDHLVLWMRDRFDMSFKEITLSVEDIRTAIERHEHDPYDPRYDAAESIKQYGY